MDPNWGEFSQIDEELPPNPMDAGLSQIEDETPPNSYYQNFTLPFIDLDSVEVAQKLPLPVPYEKTPTEFYPARIRVPQPQVINEGESPESMSPAQNQLVEDFYAAATQMQGTPVLIDDEVLPAPDYTNLEDVVFDDEFSILVDSVVEGKLPLNRIGYKDKEGRISSIFEIFDRIVRSEEQKVRECVNYNIFDMEDMALNRANLETDTTFVDIKAAVRKVPNVFLLKAIDKLMKADIKNRIYHVINATDRTEEQVHIALQKESKKVGFETNEGGTIEILSYLGTTGTHKSDTEPCHVTTSARFDQDYESGIGGLMRDKFAAMDKELNVTFEDLPIPNLSIRSEPENVPKSLSKTIDKIQTI